MKKTIRYVLIIFTIWFLFHTAIISYIGLRDGFEKSDVAVVLGNKVEKNGKPSKRLQARLDKAVEIYKTKYCKAIIVSGGIEPEGFNEAKAMKEYLLQQGIPGENVILDEKGNDTFLTAENSRNLMHQHHYKTVIIVSQFYHIARTKLAFEKVGISRVQSASPSFFEIRDFYSLFREFFGYYKYVLKTKAV